MLLFYGAYALRDSDSRRLWRRPGDGMGEEDMAYYQSCYFGGDENYNDIRFNALKADLTGLPQRKYEYYNAGSAIPPIWLSRKSTLLKNLSVTPKPPGKFARCKLPLAQLLENKNPFNSLCR